MGAFGERASAREAEKLRAQREKEQARANLESAWKEIETGATDVLAGIRTTLDVEAAEANSDGYKARVDDLRLDSPPQVGSQLSFELRRPDMGVVDDSTYSVVVTVAQDGRVRISSNEQPPYGNPRSVLESEDLGAFGEWPFVVRIQAYLNRFIDKVENQ